MKRIILISAAVLGVVAGSLFVLNLDLDFKSAFPAKQAAKAEQVQWEQYIADHGHCGFLLPGKTEMRQGLRQEGDHTVTVMWWRVEPPKLPATFNFTFWVSLDSEKDADKLLDRAVVALAEGDKSKQPAPKRIELERTPGREVVFERQDEHGSYYQLSRVYLRRRGRSHMYHMGVRTRLKPDLYASYTRTFLDSLKLLDK
jgi:hypothetical protein